MKVLEWSQHFSHYKSMGIFPDAQGHVTHKSLVGSCRISNPFEILWLDLLPARIKKNKSRMKELEWSQDFPLITLWELSVAMETRVLIRSSRKPNAVNPLSQWCFWWNLIMIGRLVSEILMFESLNGCREGRRLESHTISSSWAFGSGELKIGSFIILGPHYSLFIIFWLISFTIYYKKRSLFTNHYISSIPS